MRIPGDPCEKIEEFEVYLEPACRNIHETFMTRSSARIIAIVIVGLCGSWRPARGLGQTAAVPDDTLIALQRTACFGTCPVYSVTIDAKGNVTYDGTKHVRVTGRQTDRITVSGVAALLDTARRIGFFELRDHYRTIRNADGSETMVTDLPTVIVTITSGGRTKRVEDYLGAPDGLKELEQQIDDTARTTRWIRAEEHTLRDSRARRTPRNEQ
jgi:Domain of unknown function (DUF6438)